VFCSGHTCSVTLCRVFICNVKYIIWSKSVLYYKVISRDNVAVLNGQRERITWTVRVVYLGQKVQCSGRQSNLVHCIGCGLK
jgi:hypothetical protein